MIRFYSDWPGLLRPRAHNWVDFSLLHLSFENDRRFGNFEWHVALLGFHVQGAHRIGDGDAELLAGIDEMLAAIDSGEARVSIPLAEYEALKATSVARDATLHVACQSGAVIREEGE